MSIQIRLAQLRKRLPDGLTGGALLFASSTIVNAGNYAFNLILGRWLGPAAFADASLIITLFLVITFVTVALQTTTAKFAAVYSAAERPAAVAELRRWLNRAAWLGGLGMLAVFGLGAPIWQHFFHTNSAWLFVIFALGVPFYFVLGVERGILQGQARFGTLSANFQAEMWARLIFAVGLVALGWSVFGAVAGLTLSLVVAWLVAWRSLGTRPACGELMESERAGIVRFAGPVVAALAGQILINNSDVLVVKHFFSADEAGLYAALALIGRIVFFATWSVVTVIFPLVAQRHHRGEAHRHLLYAGLGIVAAISAPIVLGSFLLPEPFVLVLFGQAYLPVASLLGSYALATSLYALANVVISYRLSIDSPGG
ncbi:MAG: oligosaccharide flippase family protein, partial [Oscillochloris sp.]|nr:oligosaccharide flippase family protein [Oscillochloris sp.]